MLASGRNGAESSMLSGARYSLAGSAAVIGGCNAGAGLKTAAVRSSVSKSRMMESEVVFSHAGGCILALRCLFNRRASQRGSGVGKGGFNGCVGP